MSDTQHSNRGKWCSKWVSVACKKSTWHAQNDENDSILFVFFFSIWFENTLCRFFRSIFLHFVFDQRLITNNDFFFFCFRLKSDYSDVARTVAVVAVVAISLTNESNRFIADDVISLNFAQCIIFQLTLNSKLTRRNQSHRSVWHRTKNKWNENKRKTMNEQYEIAINWKDCNRCVRMRRERWEPQSLWNRQMHPVVRKFYQQPKFSSS